MLRQITNQDFAGKTVQSVNNDSTNVVRFTFVDGTTAEIWAEQAIYTPAGYIPGVFIEDGQPDPSIKK